MNLARVITDVQKELVKQGHRIEVDGLAGVETWRAIYSELLGHEIVDEPALNRVDERSEKNITTLHPKVQPYARALVKAAKDQNILVKVTSGTRSFEEQAELYRKYKAGTGGMAAPPGYSNHNYGIAFDVTMFKPDGKTPVWESPKYRQVGALGQSLGLSWGGDFGDEPHFALRPVWARGMSESKMISELRRRKAAGQDAFA